MRTSDRIDRFLANEENKKRSPFFKPKPSPCRGCGKPNTHGLGDHFCISCLKQIDEMAK